MAVTVSETLTERVRRIAEEAIAAPLFLVDVVVRGHKGSRVVELFVDSDEKLVVDDLASLSREIGFLLETADVIDGRYKLDVSSPGLDRPLVLPRQFAKNEGRRISVSYYDRERRSNNGTLLRANGEGFEIELENGEVKKIAYGEAKEVRILLPW